jgi:hypothetical protein
MQGKPTLWQVVKSVLAAMFGVQNSQNRERDFTQGNPWVFIIVGIVMVILFVLAIYGVVHLVIANK